jgi:hypothetical protein
VGEGPASILAAVRRQEEERQRVEEAVGQLAKHVKDGRWEGGQVGCRQSGRATVSASLLPMAAGRRGCGACPLSASRLAQRK